LTEIFRVELLSDDDQCSELILPAGDHALRDMYARLRQPLHSPFGWSLLQCRGYEYLAPFIQGESLLSVNELARQLSRMDSRQRTAFEGITRREMELRRGPFGVEDLLHYAQSVDLCHVVSEATDDESLGRFYAENGFVPEVDDLPDKVFEMLDFAKLGRDMRRGEKGIFTQSGYVLLHEEIDRTPVPVPDQPMYPDYAFLLKLERYPFENEGLKQPEQIELKLPASEEQLQQAVERLAVGNWCEGLYTIEDSAIPNVLEESDTLGSLRRLNDLARAIAELSQEGFTKYKALLEATQCGNIEAALDYISGLEQYTLNCNICSYEQLAKEDIFSYADAKTADMLFRHLNLDSYGREVEEQEHGCLTPYGYIVQVNAEPIISEKKRFAISMEDGYGAKADGLTEGVTEARNQTEADAEMGRMSM